MPAWTTCRSLVIAPSSRRLPNRWGTEPPPLPSIGDRRRRDGADSRKRGRGAASSSAHQRQERRTSGGLAQAHLVAVLLADDNAVAHPDDPVTRRTDLGIVRHDHECLAALAVEAAEEREHLGASG